MKHDFLIEQLIHDQRFDFKPDGTIYRFLKTSETWKRADILISGQRYIQVSYQGVMLFAHRAIVRKFHGPLRTDFHVNHKNCNKFDNRPENLELVSPLQNSNHAWKNGLIKGKILKTEKKKTFAKRFGQQMGSLYRDGCTQGCIAKRFKVSRQYVDWYLKNRSIKKTGAT